MDSEFSASHEDLLRAIHGISHYGLKSTPNGMARAIARLVELLSQRDAAIVAEVKAEGIRRRYNGMVQEAILNPCT